MALSKANPWHMIFQEMLLSWQKLNCKYLGTQEEGSGKWIERERREEEKKKATVAAENGSLNGALKFI